LSEKEFTEKTKIKIVKNLFIFIPYIEFKYNLEKEIEKELEN
tara:strand:+ start:61 stop:186 length:126 start_codon:yes stop_codon:yes gene_type:complete